ncbi:hypothetical protein GCM10027280_29820 [Micromonospora polyrhachis]|uniref:Uncharacterized protein n=1 Tax=Micromonospora polyrhachis TaxID=1282883 RepID=A0A7W7SR51_9ACTN|nr:hypothetical protein [Micromonospora polyrhachis]MBB4959036.1 hypothetical protein [Micromonospora polyrhachis]
MVHVPTPGAMSARLLNITSVLAVAALLAACGVPPELEPPRSTLPTLVSPTASGPVTATPPPPSAAPTPTPSPTVRFPESTTTDCQGSPSRTQLTALLRRQTGLLPAGAQITVTTGPLCSGEWQYSVVQIPDREPLQVVTKGESNALTLVTAGTDVCNIPVRIGAPTGIRFIACERTVVPAPGG